MNTTGSRTRPGTPPWPDFPEPPVQSHQVLEWHNKIQLMWRDFRLQLDRTFKKSNESPFVRGMILAWRRPLAEIPEGWNLCDGTNGTVDLRGSFIRCVAADEEPGGTGGSELHTPEGTNSAPDFIGGEARTSEETAGIAAGTFAGTPGTTSSDSAGTPAGTNSAPTFTGSSANTSSDSAGTPAGTNADESSHTHTFTASGTAATPDLVSPDILGTGVSPTGTTDSGSAHTHTFTGSALAGHQHTVTATGTVSAPTFTGAALAAHDHDFTPAGTFTGAELPPHSHSITAAGTVSAPVFTGTPANYDPPYYKLAFIEKL